MAATDDKRPSSRLIKQGSKIEKATVVLKGDDTLQVEFEIEDLVRRLMPPGDIAAHCGGCDGCAGCSM